MGAMAFDTLKLAQSLQEGGFDRRQAEGLATALSGAFRDDVATKHDIQALRAEMNDRFHGVDARFQSIDGRFKDLEQRLTIKLGTMIAVAVGVVATLVKLL